MDPRPARLRVAVNPYRRDPLPAALVPPPPQDALTFHRLLPGYRPSPLLTLPTLAAELGLAALWVKDEGQRFGLGAFKALGASYAIHRWTREQAGGRPTTFATATDGNHGRAVAWTARMLGQRAVIFVPRNTVPARIDAIRGEGADVVVVGGTYDDAVRRAAAESAAHGWQVISDTAYPSYTEIPGWIMAGYETIFFEAAEQLDAVGAGGPTAVLLQAGVGGLACAGVWFYARRTVARRPGMVAVEPTDADCLLESITSPDGGLREGRGGQNSIMAGLNCGTPSLAAWPVLRAGIDVFLAVDDRFAEEAMRRLAAGGGGDPVVVAGESGAAGLAGLLALGREPELRHAREALGFGPQSRVLIVNTEGATDPASYRRIVGVDRARAVGTSTEAGSRRAGSGPAGGR